MADLNVLVEIFTKMSISIKDVYWDIRQPGASHKGYKTNVYAFLFPISGRASYIFNGEEYELIPGKVIHCPPNIIVDKHVIGQGQWEYYIIHYTLTNPMDEQEVNIANLFELEIGESPKITELLRVIYKVSKEPGCFPAFRVKQLFYNILEEVFTSYRNILNSDSQTMMKEALDYIHNYYMEDLSLEQMSTRFQMKTDQFSYWFHKYTGVRPSYYLIMHRLKIAEEILRIGNCTVGQAAESVGYHDAYYFSRLFKKYKGISPSEIKNDFQKNPL